MGGARCRWPGGVTLRIGSELLMMCDVHFVALPVNIALVLSIVRLLGHGGDLSDSGGGLGGGGFSRLA